MFARSYEAWGPPALLAVLTVAAFANAVPNGFVWIDHWQVESGGLIAGSLGELWTAFREPLGNIPGWEGAAPYARPLVITVLSVVRALADLHPAAYHLALVSLHVGNVLLAYSVLATLTGTGLCPTLPGSKLQSAAWGHAGSKIIGSPSGAGLPSGRFAGQSPGTAAVAFFAAGLFAVHPLQTAAVSWISGIADPLFTLCVLLAFRLQLSAARGGGRSPWLRLGAALSFALALAAKETAAVFPLLLAAAYMLFPQHTQPQTASAAQPGSTPRPRDRLLHVLIALAPFLLVLFIDLLYRLLVLHGGAFGGTFAAIPFGVRLCTAPRLVWNYLTLPLRFQALTVCDDYALSSAWTAAPLGGVLGVALLLAAVAASARRRPQLCFALLWMLLALLPVLNLVPILHYRADRFFYFPMIGWSLALVTAVQWCAGAAAARFAPSRRAAAMAGTIALVALAVLTVRRNALFADDRTLFEATVQVSPFCREAHTTLGDAYLRSGRSDEAVRQYQLALAPQPERASYVVQAKVLINLGMAQLARRDYAAAAEAFGQAHRLQPGLLHPLFGLGIANLALGRVADAVGWLEQAYAADADDPDVSFNLALGYDRLGRSADAAAMYQHYLTIAPRGRARTLAEERLRKLATQ